MRLWRRLPGMNTRYPYLEHLCVLTYGVFAVIIIVAWIVELNIGATVGGGELPRL